MATPLMSPYSQFFDSNGDPLSGGKVYFYSAGTTTPKDTYTDAGGLTPAANPVILDSSGRAAIWITGTYRIDVYTSTDALVRSVDNVPAFTAGGDMTKAVYDPANIAQQVVGTTAVQTLSNKTLSDTAAPITADGRLTLTTATPVTTSDVTGATTIYYTPYRGNKIALYTGSAWVMLTFTELSLALGTLSSGKPYDVFLDYNNGIPALAMLAWANDSTRATALARQDGVLVKSGTATQRYLGTFYTTSTTTTEDSAAKRYLWNYYNRVNREFASTIETASGTGTWNYSLTTVRQANANTANQVEAVIGVAEDALHINCPSVTVFSSGATYRSVAVGVGVDSTSTFSSTQSYEGRCTSSVATPTLASYTDTPAAGRHYFAWLEKGGGTDTQSWYVFIGTGYSTARITGWVRA